MEYDDVFEFSEFSKDEILYMGHEGLTYLIECMQDLSMRDPFEVVAEIEEALGHALAWGAEDM